MKSPFEEALDYAVEWQREGHIEMSVIKLPDGAYAAIASRFLKPQDTVVAKLRMILYGDYMAHIGKKLPS